MMLVRLLVWVVFGLASLAAVMTFNTLRYTSTQIAVDPVEPVEIAVEAAAERLARAISVRTISNQNPDDFEPEPFVELNAYIRESFPGAHVVLRLFERDRLTNAFIRTTTAATLFNA